MIARGGLAALLALGLVACGDQVVHIRLSGERSSPGCLPEDHGLEAVWKVDAKLRIVSELPTGSTTSHPVDTCVEIYGRKTTLAELERTFAQTSSDYAVHAEGKWSVGIIGFPKGDSCSDRPTQTPLLCGAASGEVFPPSDNQIIVPIDCMPRTSTDQNIKERLKQCAVPFYP